MEDSIAMIVIFFNKIVSLGFPGNCLLSQQRNIRQFLPPLFFFFFAKFNAKENKRRNYCLPKEGSVSVLMAVLCPSSCY